MSISSTRSCRSIRPPSPASPSPTARPATPIRLYRVTYSSVVPERGNKPTVASGLLAIPERRAAPRFRWCRISTAPSTESRRSPRFRSKSSETQLMLAQFAGQGYVVIGADYFGSGTSSEPEGYMVKASHQQATHDMLIASRAVLDHLKLTTTKLFLAGWSQGGFVTMAMLEKLEQVRHQGRCGRHRQRAGRRLRRAQRLPQFPAQERRVPG